MALNQWPKRFLVVFAAICAAGGFLAGSSQSQVRQNAPAGEVGRYQAFANGDAGWIVFDTKFARFWQAEKRYTDDAIELHWVKVSGPFDPPQKIGTPVRITIPTGLPAPDPARSADDGVKRDPDLKYGSP